MTSFTLSVELNRTLFLSLRQEMHLEILSRPLSNKRSPSSLYVFPSLLLSLSFAHLCSSKEALLLDSLNHSCLKTQTDPIRGSKTGLTQWTSSFSLRLSFYFSIWLLQLFIIHTSSFHAFYSLKFFFLVIICWITVCQF